MRFALLFGFGAVTISFFDGFHTHSHTTVYPHAWILEMAWWTPLLFGSVVAFGGIAYAIAHRRLGGNPKIHSIATLATAFVLFGILYFASGYLPASNASKLVVMLAGAAGLWTWLDRSPAGIALAIVNAIGGCSTEVTLVHFDAFRHLQPDLLGIPIWLPGLYLAAAPVIGHVARRVLHTRETAQRQRPTVWLP